MCQLNTIKIMNDKLKDNPDGKVEWVDIPSVQQQKLKEQGLKQ